MSQGDSIPVVSTTAVGDDARAMPGLWAEPNVTRGGTVLRFGRPLERGGALSIFDAAGRPVATLKVPAGARSVAWSGASNVGAPVRSGVYFVRLVTPGGEFSTRLVVRR